MTARPLLPTLGLTLLAAAAGFLLAYVLGAGGDEEGDPPSADRATEMHALRMEVERLREELGAREGPSLSGRESSQGAYGAEAGSGRASAPRRPTRPAISGASSSPSAPPAELPIRAGGALDLIRTLAEDATRDAAAALVGDPRSMALLFEATAEGPILRAEEIRPDGEIVDGTTIVLDEGTHDFRAFAGAHRGDFPADVTFRGIGMDRTRLILHEISSTGEARNLAFEDLTLDTLGHYLADVRGDEPISLRFERVRVIGWDQKPGGAVLLAARHGAVLGLDSRFEAGFGNAPGDGAFFHVRGPFLVRFERCAFVGPFARLYEKSDRAAYAWVECRFSELPEALRRDLESPEPNLRFENCSFGYRSEGAAPPARSRTELDPAWR